MLLLHAIEISQRGPQAEIELTPTELTGTCHTCRAYGAAYRIGLRIRGFEADTVNQCQRCFFAAALHRARDTL